jgi:hypothetical protein
MLQGEFDAADAAGAEALLSQYAEFLRETVRRVGEERVAERSAIGDAVIERVIDGDVVDLSLSEAAAILATDPDLPDAGRIVAEGRDILLLGMTTAVVDVDILASQLETGHGAKELQQKLEGRHPITLGEYARVHYHLGEHAE